MPCVAVSTQKPQKRRRSRVMWRPECRSESCTIRAPCHPAGSPATGTAPFSRRNTRAPKSVPYNDSAKGASASGTGIGAAPRCTTLHNASRSA